LRLWCALDDMSEANGTISVLPFSRAGTRDVIDHVKDPELNDLAWRPCDRGRRKHRRLLVDAVASQWPNRTNRPRRGYVVQYSSEPILRADGTPFGLAEALLVGGRKVLGSEIAT
jgi:hypothetical protein